MRMDFSSVTPEARAALFPVLLEEHNPDWRRRYREEEKNLVRLFGEERILRISHIGSTSVPGLLAKPTVDILVEITRELCVADLSERMLDGGYVVNTPPEDLIMYLKGYTPQGFAGQAFHIHVRHSGDWDELYFRDYLTAHPQAAREYEGLKRKLQQRFPNDRDGYTHAKTAFVEKYTRLARQEFPGRYLPRKAD